MMSQHETAKLVVFFGVFFLSLNYASTISIYQLTSRVSVQLLDESISSECRIILNKGTKSGLDFLIKDHFSRETCTTLLSPA